VLDCTTKHFGRAAMRHAGSVAPPWPGRRGQGAVPNIIA
jgi:hypothetical protein